MHDTEMRPFATKILAHMGETVLHVDFLARGATCKVWKIQSEHRSYALRVIEADSRAVDSDLDEFVRATIHAKGGRVSEPILSSGGINLRLTGKRWSLDAFVPGEHPVRGALSEAVCRQLGETLAILHSLPVRDFGKPSHVNMPYLVGQKTDPLDGVMQRFENPIPQTWEDGFVHPLLSNAPDILPQILAHLRQVAAVVGDGNSVLCHSDIHEKQLICAKGALAALIDFGDATILDRHWDLGSVLYFHGKANAAIMLEAYQSNLGPDTILPEAIPSFSVAVAMHHASRSTKPAKGHRLDRAIRHVRQIVTGE
ncbi:aminoglycoside phosphotransferase family protein [Sneathiella marina]|uniref:Aminoglycoside phosphotransferase family protein n=1 Tax=Sneathiella marina TaxID=2950108 RepID=A0ABY4W770_9PROT|nr:aminoglycoside phosphotransferase family protein [Sneathiella marina]USG62872.1 aminoglycoside phosphotransferase family protein [Sneathiella marina]